MRLLSMAAAAFSVAITVGVPLARAADCEALWVERNSYYKEYGYCFKTAPAIRRFGNESCRYNNEADIPFPREIRNRILEIRQIEQTERCPV
jgi:hypothetical protein